MQSGLALRLLSRRRRHSISTPFGTERLKCHAARWMLIFPDQMKCFRGRVYRPGHPIQDGTLGLLERDRLKAADMLLCVERQADLLDQLQLRLQEVDMAFLVGRQILEQVL